MPLEESLWFASLDRFLMIDWFDFLQEIEWTVAGFYCVC